MSTNFSLLSYRFTPLVSIKVRHLDTFSPSKSPYPISLNCGRPCKTLWISFFCSFYQQRTWKTQGTLKPSPFPLSCPAAKGMKFLHLLKFYQFLLNPAKSGYESACCGVILGMKQFFGINRNRVWEIGMREKWLTKGFWWFKICEGEKSLLFRASLLQQWTVRYCGLWNYLLWGCELDQETENMLLPAKPKDLGF